MANNKAHPNVRPALKDRDKVFHRNMETIVNMMDHDPAFFGITVEVDYKNKSHRTPTPYGNVMYYLTSSRWQWKHEVHIGGPEVFVPWLAHLINTGESNRAPEKTTRKSGII